MKHSGILSICKRNQNFQDNFAINFSSFYLQAYLFKADWPSGYSFCQFVRYLFFGLGSNLRLANIFFAIDDIMVEQDMSIDSY